MGGRGHFNSAFFYKTRTRPWVEGGVALEILETPCSYGKLIPVFTYGPPKCFFYSAPIRKFFRVLSLD